MLEFQLGIPRASLRECRINSPLTRVLPRHLAEKHQVFPLEVKEGRILVAMADPLDYLAIEAVRRSTGLLVEVCLATRSEVEDAIERYYPLPQKSGAPGT